MFPEPEDSIFLYLSQDIYDQIIEEATKWVGRETGGMLFGTIRNINGGLDICIERMEIPPDNLAVREHMYFEIDPEYAKQLLEQETTLYLGNWHKHLGYGGPSHRDHGEISDFFMLNPHRNLILALIVDFLPDSDPEVIIELYRRDQALATEPSSANFETLRIPVSNIRIMSAGMEISPLKPIGILPEQLLPIKEALIEVFDTTFTLNDIQEFPGSTRGEKIISFPYKFTIIVEGSELSVNVLVLLSFPSNFPEGQLYIDISSSDMSRNFTVEKHPANLLVDPDLLHPFLLSLKASLEGEVLELLSEPLWKIMEGLN